jgi:hypothetical protein
VICNHGKLIAKLNKEQVDYKAEMVADYDHIELSEDVVKTRQP